MTTKLELGKKYRVVRAGLGEYLTVGDTYVLDALSRHTVGLHRENNGSGTYVRMFAITSGQIVLEAALPREEDKGFRMLLGQS